MMGNEFGHKFGQAVRRCTLAKLSQHYLQILRVGGWGHVCTRACLRERKREEGMMIISWTSHIFVKKT